VHVHAAGVDHRIQKLALAAGLPAANRQARNYTPAVFATGVPGEQLRRIARILPLDLFH
jgi:hypothetical protein